MEGGRLCRSNGGNGGGAPTSPRLHWAGRRLPVRGEINMEGGRPRPPGIRETAMDMPDQKRLLDVAGVNDPDGGALIDGLLGDGADVQIPIHGRSMWPFLRDGMTATIEPIRGQPLFGEIVLYRRQDGSIRLHRVMRGRAGGTDGKYQVLLRGDAFGSGAEWIGLERCLGRLRDYRFAGGPIRANLGWRCAAGVTWNLAIHILRRLAAMIGMALT